jgi:predicted negative regulator of RcsB-dependent stress response
MPESYQPPDAIWWKKPPLLLEWACALMRARPEPSTDERLWHMAAIATAQRAGDYEFMLGSPWEERGNPGDEFEHLNHVIARFPDEPRSALAQAVAIEWRTWPTNARRSQTAARNLPRAVDGYRTVMRNDAIAAEAMIRLGFVRLRGRQPDDALEWLERGEPLTRDPYVVYLARYFRGQALERKRDVAGAEAAYRAALATVPRAQSATMALSAILARSGRPLEASALVEASLAEPIAPDPWREYGAADDRFWPDLIGRLHAAIASPPPRPGTLR